MVRVTQAAAAGEASLAPPTALKDKPSAPLTVHAPTAPSHSNVPPAVTGVLQDTLHEAVASHDRGNCHRVQSPSPSIPREIWMEELRKSFVKGEISQREYLELAEEQGDIG